MYGVIIALFSSGMEHLGRATLYFMYVLPTSFTLLSKYIGIHYIIANCISVLVGIITSFALNRSINFKVKDKTGKRFLIFLTVGLCGLLLSNVILYVGIDMLSGDELIVKLASIVLVVGFQFLLNKFVTFKEK